MLLELKIRHNFFMDKIKSLGSCNDVDISFLSYVNDVLIVTKANKSNCEEILDTLDKFKN